LTDLEPQSYRFGSYTLEARERRLLHKGVGVPLKPRALDALLYLVERAGHLVTKEELLARLWPDSVVEESNLAKNIWLIRRAFVETQGEEHFVETVPRAGYRFVGPVERVSAEAAASRHEGGSSAPASPPIARAVRRSGSTSGARPAAIALGAVGVILAGLAVWALAARGRAALHDRGSLPAATGASAPAAVAAATVAAAPVRASVAVLGFENLSRRSDSTWLATALTEMMSADLAAGEKLRLVSGADAMRLARTLPPEPGALPRGALAAARYQLAADFVVKGSYVALPGPDGEALRLDVVLQSTASGETVCTVSGTGAAQRLFVLVDEAATRLRGKLGLEAPVIEGSRAAAAAALPARPEAAQLYAEGLEKLRQSDAMAARPLLERAITIEPGYPLAHVALSQALAALGFDQGAVGEAKKAVALSGRLTRAQQLEIAAGLAEAQKDWTAAASTNRALLAFYPDNLEYGLSLVRTEIAGGKAAEALAVIATLRRRAAPAGQDPRLDLAEADASRSLSDWPHELASAGRAAAAARARGTSLLLGEALSAEASAEGNLGETKLAEAAGREAAAIFHAAGNSNAEAGVRIGIANAKADRGDYDGAIADYRQVLATFERSGNRKGAARVWSDVANLSWMQGNVEESLKSAGRELALSHEINDRRGIVWGLGAIGNARADQGEIATALRMQTEALAISREIGDREYTAFCLGAVADTHLSAGDLQNAFHGYGDALELSRGLHDLAGVARHQDDLATVLFAEGRLAEAERLYGAALAGRQRLDDRAGAAETRMNLAQVRAEQGRPAESLAMARESAQAFVVMHQSGNGAIALAVAALAEIELGQSSAAAADCERARTALDGNRQNLPNIFVWLAQARVEAAQGHAARARALAEAARARAGKARALGSVLEARLVLGGIDLGENPAAGAKRLEALAQEARSKSFLLIARKAEGLAAGGAVRVRRQG
jgi:DNA-binding winged helix-turn-helix (wHTH) protein/tetratricopeptide (TPR) repeat protein